MHENCYAVLGLRTRKLQMSFQSLRNKHSDTDNFLGGGGSGGLSMCRWHMGSWEMWKGCSQPLIRSSWAITQNLLAVYLLGTNI